MRRYLYAVIVLFLSACSSNDISVDGRWLLESETVYLSMSFGSDGYAVVTHGQQSGPLTGPALQWTYEHEVLKVFDDRGRVFKELSDLYIKDGKIHGTNRGGVKEVYEYTPSNKSV